MKLVKILSISFLISSSFAFAQTTMCFKENHPSMTTIESTPLDGGLCTSKKSVKDMKADGWSVDDIKITPSKKGNNYIYIFKKDVATISSFDEKKLEEKILLKLEKRKKEEIEFKKRDILLRMSKSGKEIYLSKCLKCHGKNAEKKAYGTSRSLNSLNLDDMMLAIRDYDLGQYDRGKAFVMRPYAASITKRDVKNIYAYIQSLKEEKKAEKKKESSN